MRSTPVIGIKLAIKTRETSEELCIAENDPRANTPRRIADVLCPCPTLQPSHSSTRIRFRWFVMSNMEQKIWETSRKVDSRPLSPTRRDCIRATYPEKIMRSV